MEQRVVNPSVAGSGRPASTSRTGSSSTGQLPHARTNYAANLLVFLKVATILVMLKYLDVASSLPQVRITHHLDRSRASLQGTSRGSGPSHDLTFMDVLYSDVIWSCYSGGEQIATRV
jgi:hypothetical protein